MMIFLVPYRPEFLELFVAWRGETLTARHNPLKPMTTDEIRKMLEGEGSDLSDLKKYEAYRWFIESNGKIVGNVSVKNISHMMNYAEIGYGVGQTHHNQGIATSAITAMINKAFSESSLRKLMAFVHDKNIPSCRVLEKLGFAREGLLREHYIINGLPENEVLYGLLKQEWHGAAE
jgi:[ribosomal protein S5]-alanine N-acetyltransferase